MKKQMIRAIALGPMQNTQGGMSFVSLKTGRKHNRDEPDCTMLPMPEEEIERVHEMVQHEPEGLVDGNDESAAGEGNNDTAPDGDDECKIKSMHPDDNESEEDNNDPEPDTAEDEPE